MGRTRHGKIASLPPGLQEQVNLRLLNREELRSIERWLNAKPEAQKILGEKFGGEAVSIQNLSEWKRHGHREWLVRREALEDARNIKEQAGELQEATSGALADHMAEVLMARLLRAFRTWDGSLQSRSGKELMMPRGMCREAGEMRRASHSAIHLQLEREHLELERRNQNEFMKSEFDKWLGTPDARERVMQVEKKARWRHVRLRQLFGMDPLPEDEAESESWGVSRQAQNALRETLAWSRCPKNRRRVRMSAIPRATRAAFQVPPNMLKPSAKSDDSRLFKVTPCFCPITPTGSRPWYLQNPSDPDHRLQQSAGASKKIQVRD